MFTTKRAACTCALAALAMCALVAEADDEERGVVLLPVCSSDAIEDVHRAHSSAVVAVRAPGLHGLPTSGIGFVFGSRRHVATAFSLVENGRGIEVIVDDDAREAVVVAFNRTSDVAILRLERAATVPPLLTARGAIPVGEPVLALGRSDETPDADVVVNTGIVTSAKDKRLRTNALDGPSITHGGPVLDCAGEVVGVATGNGIAVAAVLEDLFYTIDPAAEPYASGWSLFHPMVTFHGQLDAAPGQDRHNGWLGFGVGTAVIGDDVWYFPIEARVMLLAGPRPADPLAERTGMRLQLASAAGYRFLLAGADSATYLIPTAGAVLSYDEIVTRTASLALQPGCAPPNRCAISASPVEEVTSLLRLMPTIGLKLQFGFGVVGYELAIDVTTPQRSIHQMSTGFQF